MSERDGIRLAIECVNRHNHGFIKCHPMFIRGHNEAVKAITKELWSLIETAPIGGDYFEGFSEGVKVGRQETDNALREENARLREALKPFADIAPKYDPPEGDDDQPLYDTRNFPTIGMVRAAADAIREGEKDG